MAECIMANYHHNQEEDEWQHQRTSRAVLSIIIITIIITIIIAIIVIINKSIKAPPGQSSAREWCRRPVRVKLDSVCQW